MNVTSKLLLALPLSLLALVANGAVIMPDLANVPAGWTPTAMIPPPLAMSEHTKAEPMFWELESLRQEIRPTGLLASRAHFTTRRVGNMC